MAWKRTLDYLERIGNVSEDWSVCLDENENPVLEISGTMARVTLEDEDATLGPIVGIQHITNRPNYVQVRSCLSTFL